MSRGELRAGDWVAVRSAREILSTLDADGTVNGLPFMPEMLDCCGKSFRIQRRVEKTCVEVSSPVYSNRRFSANDVVMLEGPRCDGSHHDGCKRGCRIFWRADWLRPVEGPSPPALSTIEEGLSELQARLKVRVDEQRYFCQSTELLAATEAFPGRKKPWMVRVAFREVRNGDRSLAEIAILFGRWCWQMLRNTATGEEYLRGPNKTTPSVSLDLKVGEVVRVRTRDQIAATLSERGRNRGMGISNEMTRCCGKEAVVRIRVDRIIEERTGRMRQIQNTVMLRDMRGEPNLCEECLCSDQMGDCPRGELMYWREAWLERTKDPVLGTPTGG